ncbi:MAG: DUF1549 domain-containing protein [Planctomycetaceae bacterium]
MRTITRQTIAWQTIAWQTSTGRTIARWGTLALWWACFLLGALVSAAAWCRAAEQVVASDGIRLEQVVVGTPARIEVFPPVVRLSGDRQQMQLVVTGHYADGGVQDLTRASGFASSSPTVAVVDNAVVRPRADGTAEVAVSVGGLRAIVPVEVTGQGSPERVAFETGALVALTKNGCNSGACHGSPSGKGGFRLSLRAFDPALDELTLIREESGRRINPFEPESSLLLAKPLMKVSHGGGVQLHKTDPAYRVLRDWIAEGCRLDPPDAPRVTRLEVHPPSGRVLERPAHTQQLCVLAHFADGAVRDVTPLASYSSSDTGVAVVDEAGFVVARDRGEAAIVVRYLEHVQTCSLTFVRDIPGFAWSPPTPANFIDEHVYAKLEKLQFEPSGRCTDGEFLRRVHLDLVGILPTVDETRAFLADTDPGKRERLVETLLARPEFAKFWALKWGDLLRMTSTAVGGDGVHKYHRWVERAIADNMPYDRFARELLTASGSTLVNPPANFYRTTADANDCVETISQVFLGSRLQCAKCHNHPFERWTQDDYYGMAAVFSRVQKKKTLRANELVVWSAATGDVTQPRTGKRMKPWAPGVGDLEVGAEEDRRDPFVDWLTAAGNPFFARVEVNRIWAQVFGRGLVEPIDDFRESNPAANVALLAALARDFVAHGFDRRHAIRTILRSNTYQASFLATPLNQDDAKYASHYQPRLLTAEQLLDAICGVTDVPETFGRLPPGTKATQVPSPDLADNDFMKAFGQPNRQTVCACERGTESNVGMAVQFFNGPLISEKVRSDDNRFRRMIRAGATDAEILDDLYLAAVCRPPTASEMEASLKHLAGRPDRIAAFEDICWALLNTNEFLFQH